MSQVWLVTGSSRGLGRAIVEASLAAGNKVMATARNTESLNDLSDRYGNQVKLFALDVTDESAATAAVKTAIDTTTRKPFTARSTPRAPDARVSRTGSASAQQLTEATHDADYSGFQEPRQSDLARHPGRDGLLHLLAGLPSGRRQPQEQRRGQDRRRASGHRDCPTVGPDANPTLVKQYNKPYTYPPDTLVNNEIGWKTEWLDHRLLVNGSAYIMDWKNVQTLIYNPPIFGNTTFGVAGPDYRIKGIELQIVARGHRGLDAAGFDFAQQRQGDQLAVPYVVEPGQPDTDRQLHHAGVVADLERECASAKSARHRRCNAGLLADDRVQPARALRLASQRLQDVLLGRRAARRRHAERAEQLPVGRRSHRADHVMAALRPAGIHDV